MGQPGLLDFIFPTAFSAIAVYLLSVALLSLRLGALYRADHTRVGRPYFFFRIEGNWPWFRAVNPFASFGFLFSARHRDFRDPMLSLLVWIVRGLFVVSLAMVAATFSSTLLLDGANAQ